MGITAKLARKGKPYTVAFDAEGVVDTVVDGKGRALSSKSKIVATIIRNSEAIAAAALPLAMIKAGWKWAR